MDKNPAPGPDFTHIETWVFDLDNTLYPATANLFAQIDVRMKDFITRALGVEEAEAYRLQKHWYLTHGTTLAGLMREHAMGPHPFLDFVHDIDVSVLAPAPALSAALERLPGRKVVFTNGTVAHATRVMERLGITHHMDGIFDIVHADFIPKPQVETFERFIARHGIAPARAVMFEDLARNLKPAADMGMTTVLVVPPGGHADPAVRVQEYGPQPPHVDHRTEDLTAFLLSLAVKDIAA